MNKPNIVGPEYIAELLGIEVSTVKMDARRSPTSLPPRLAIPGRKALMWIEEDVIDWLNSFRPQAKRKVGRPSQVSRQSPLASGESTFSNFSKTDAR